MADQPRIKVVGFFTRYARQPDGSMKGVDWVQYSPGQALNTQITERRVETMRPDESEDARDRGPNADTRNLHMAARWSVIGPAYEAWKKGYEIPETGTPLAAWQGVTREQADALRKIGIVTVEDFASLSDDKLNRVPMPNARSLRDTARKFLEGGDQSQFAAKLTEQDGQITALREQLDAAMQLLEEQASARKPKARKEVEEAEAA